MDISPEEVSELAESLGQFARELRVGRSPKSSKGQVSELVMQAKALIWKIQDPFDALMDHVVNGYTIAAIVSLSKMGVFEAIPQYGIAKIGQIAQKCDVEEELIRRLMRQLTCVNIFNEVRVGEWSHNRLSMVISDHVAMTGKYFCLVGLGEMLPSMIALPSYLDEFGRQSLLHTYTETPYSWYNNALGSNFWQVLDSTPDRIELFSRGLASFVSLHPIVAMFPFEDKLQCGNREDRVLAVDIGGGRGFAMLELRKSCASLRGRLILQDRSEVLDAIEPADLPGITKMPHDFFLEQPIQHAQMYYIRRVMHDWQDKDAVRILKAIKPSMGKDSRIIISDMALPEPVTPRDGGAVWLDLMMMSIGGKERTISDWASLADMSGLRLMKVWQEPEKFGPLCVVEYMLPDTESNLIDIECRTKPVAGMDQEDTWRERSAESTMSPTTMESNAIEESEQKNVDWEEGTVFGDRDQSLEPC